MEIVKSILIVDPAELIRKGIKSCITPYFKEVIWHEATSLSTAQEVIDNKQVDVILTEIRLEQSNGFQLLKLNQSRKNNSKILILSEYTKREYILAARYFGASGYFSKNISPEILVENIRRSHTSNIFTSSEWFASLYQENSAFILKTIELLKSLSKQEKKVLSLFCNNLNTKEVSSSMNVQKKSVDNYKNRIAKKMELPPELYFREWIRNHGTFLSYLIEDL